jgi:DNA-binding NarL/FixJ family response regulator
MFVDDETNVIEALRRSFRRLESDWDMVFCRSGEEALGALRGQPVDVMVTDIMMPGMSGTDLAEQMVRQHPQTRVLVLTGSGDLRHAADAVNRGHVFRFYLKPCDTAVLRAAIVEALASRPATAVSPGVFDALDLAIIVADAAGRVRSMNARATGLLARGGALRIGQDGALKAITPPSTRQLLEAVASAREGTAPAAIRLPGGDEGDDLLVAVCPLPAGAEGTDVVLVVSGESESRAPSVEALCTSYGLTPAEGRLMQRLVLGESVAEAAAAVGIAVSSARTYLKTIFSKTGVGRQSELMLKALNIPSAILATRQGRE